MNDYDSMYNLNRISTNPTTCSDNVFISTIVVAMALCEKQI